MPRLNCDPWKVNSTLPEGRRRSVARRRSEEREEEGKFLALADNSLQAGCAGVRA